MDSELMETFLEECSGLLDDLEENLLMLEENPEDEELINETFRIVHTIKGSSGLVGFSDITDFVHKAEDLLDKIRNKLLGVNNDIVNILFNTHDIIKDMLSSLIDKGYGIDRERIELTVKGIEKYSNTKKISNQTSSSKSDLENKKKSFYKIEVEFDSDLFQTGTDPLLLLRELKDLGEIIEVYTVFKRIPYFFEIDPEQCYLTIQLILKTGISYEKIKDVFVFVEIDSKVRIENVTETFTENIDETLAEKKLGEILVDKGLISEEDVEEALAEQNKVGEILTKKGKIDSKQVERVVRQQQQSRNVQEKNTIKVSTEKMELLMNSIAELIISQAKVKEQIIRSRLREDQQLDVSLKEVDKKIRLLQEEVMKARMVPIGNTFLRFRRLVRDLAKEQGKEIDLIINGRETELDKTVIEKIADPLKHMIRNAVDHGIESPEERAALGKPKTGTITLDAFHREGYIVIQVLDDGKGLNKEKILKKALEKELISSDVSLNDQEIYELIFQPGLTTADQITETSGRGVGMDVVRSNIEALRGSISISSTENKGTSYRLKLPLTMAIIDGMAVIVGDEQFIIPINSILEFYQPKEDEIKSVTGKGESVRIRGEYLNLFRLSKLFNIKNDVKDPTKGILIVLKDEDKKICLLVDEIIGQQQAVVKSLEDNYTNVQGIAGATILGDGRVAMIIDVSSLIKIAFS